MSNTSLPPLLKKYPAEYYLYGVHAVQAALKNPQRQCKALIVSTQKHAEYKHFASEKKIKIFVLSNKDIRSLLPEGAVHQGVALITSGLKEYIDLPKKMPLGAVMLLDEVTDPHNIGAILRVCAAFSCHFLILPEKNSPKITGALAKIAVGALETVHIIRVKSLMDTVKKLKKRQYTLYGADGKSQTPLQTISFPQNSAFLMGAEGKGIKRSLLDQCDHSLSISMDRKMDSLNVSVASGIFLSRYYETMAT